MEAKERLLEVFKREAFKAGQFRLASGRSSNYYIDGKMATLSAEGAYLTGKVVFDLIKDSGAEAVGGLTMGADAIATAAAVESYRQRRPIPAFFVRKQPKSHGTRKWIEGPLPGRAGARVVIVDDVITTGGSVVQAIEKVEEVGCKVCSIIVLVDRLEGGRENLRRMGYDCTPVFVVHDGQIKCFHEEERETCCV